MVRLLVKENAGPNNLSEENRQGQRLLWFSKRAEAVHHPPLGGLSPLQSTLIKKLTGLCWTQRGQAPGPRSHSTQSASAGSWSAWSSFTALSLPTPSPPPPPHTSLIDSPQESHSSVLTRRVLTMGTGMLMPSGSLCSQHSALQLLGTPGPPVSGQWGTGKLSKPALESR